MLETRLTKLLDIRYPIVCGAMHRLARAELTAAVSNAGGLGVLASTTFSSLEGLRREIKRTRELTDRPFAVNINLFPTLRPVHIEDYINMVIDEGIKIVETSGRNPDQYIDRFKRHAIKVIHKAPGVKHAKTAEKVGCDAVTVVGAECGGHPGAAEVGIMVLMPVVRKLVSIPVIAAGGIADGYGLAAALALGADGILMGTRFAATQESPAHEAVKAHIVRSTEEDTVVIQRTIGSPTRVARNEAAQKILELEAAGAGFEELRPLIQGERADKVWYEGQVNAAPWSCGQSMGLIQAIPSVAELVNAMVEEAGTAVKELVEIFAAGPENPGQALV